jgi:ATP-dependent RNA helicase DHX33
LYNSNSGLDLLKVVRISKAQALQRTGRAGRESSGTCYRIYTEEEFDSLKKNTVPEILRYSPFDLSKF